MIVYLVHHGAAVEAAVDPMRPLSGTGRTTVGALAASCAASGVRPDVVWHSGKLRARQTAEIFWSSCNPLAGIEALRGLLPGDPPHWVADRLLTEDRQVMVVGHQPHLASLWHALDATAAATPFPPHGVVALERTPDGWRTSWHRSA